VTHDIPVIVTGGAGYIGSHFCKELARQGLRPITYDNLQRGHRGAVQWGPFEQGDLRDEQRLREVFDKHRPGAVVHFAALAYVGESVERPALYYENNVVGTLCLLNAMREFDVSQIVFSSTCATYGIPDKMPISETAPQHPINPYGETKLIVERMLRDFGEAYGMRWAALRYFNAAGADPDSETGEMHEPETHLIPLVLEAASGRRSSISVFGNNYDTPDGTCIRDFIHVTDLATAHVKALEWLSAGENRGAFNLGNGQGFSVEEVIASARRVTGRDIPVVYTKRREGDPPRLIADARLARDVLGWVPERRELDDMVKDAWRWHLLHQESRPEAAAS
jgi:UDP-arabinose 4-epimerase